MQGLPLQNDRTGNWRVAGMHCRMAVERPAPGIVVLRISGHDIGEFGDAPMRELERYLTGDGPVELFIDARETAGASIDVSSEWARWLDTHRRCFSQIVMLTGSRYIEVTAAFVRRAAGLGAIMRIVSDTGAFARQLTVSMALARGGRFS